MLTRPIAAALFLCLSLAPLCAETPEDPDVIRARSQLEYTRSLLERGIATRAQVEAAQQAVTEAEEDRFLKSTLYGRDVTEADADQMVAITARRVERRRDAVARMQQIVDAGAAARLSLTPLREQLEWVTKQHEFAVTRAKLVHEMAGMAREEAAFQAKIESAPAEAQSFGERYQGNGRFTPADFTKISRAFQRAFSKSIPVSANGETAVHRALGFDHRNRIDVAINPDQPEGVWLRQFLTANHIPYFAFRSAVAGKATGPHIHIGPMSGHLAQSD